MCQDRMLELAPSGLMMVNPKCEHCGANTLAVNSIVHGKYRECWRAYHGFDNCPGTDRFKTDPYAGVEFVPFESLDAVIQIVLKRLYPRSRYFRPAA